MAKELNEDTGFKVSIKTLGGIGVAIATVVSMWFALQADIQEAKELQEELALTVKEDDIKWLYNSQPTSPGCLNEVTSLGVVIINDFMKQLPENIRNKIKGVKDEGEFIKTKILTLDEARVNIKDMKFHATIGLIETKIRNNDKDLIKLKFR